MHLFDFSPKWPTHHQEDLEKYQSTFRNSAQNTPASPKKNLKICNLKYDRGDIEISLQKNWTF